MISFFNSDGVKIEQSQLLLCSENDALELEELIAAVVGSNVEEDVVDPKLKS